MARKSYDPKEANLRIRLNEEMKAYVDKLSKELGLTISDTIRHIIQTYREKF